MNPHIIFLLNKSLESLRNSNLNSAEHYLQQAAKLQKNNPHVLRLLGVVSAQKKQPQDALKYLTKSLKFLPNNALTLSNLGNVYVDLGDYENALKAYDSAINKDPNYEEVWTNKGILLGKMNRYQEALEFHEKAIALKSNYAQAWSNKGNALCELTRYEDALLHYQKAIDLNPQYAEGWYNKANLLADLKLFVDAIFHYERAITLNTDLDWIYGHLIHTKMQVCDWSFFQEIRNDIVDKVRQTKKITHPFPLMSLVDDVFLHQQASSTYSKDLYSSNYSLGQIAKRPLGKKIRIGYFSADFRDHPVSHLTSQLFEMHDRDQFEVIAFSLHNDLIHDQTNIRLRKAFDQFIEVDKLSNKDITLLSRDLEIDIAVDLSGHTKNSKPLIFSFRAAPIQVNWLGYPGTFGADCMDYIIADESIIPEKYKDFYNEKIVYLPNSYMVDDSNRIASNRIFTKAECGLPNDKFIFCCFNSFYKFNPTLLDSWSHILLEIGNSVLWISEGNQLFQTGLISEFERRGIESSRIVFARRENLMSDHLARYSLADLFLDTFPYNAHTTALDALKTGLPVLTRIGESFPSRVAASLLHAIGLPELITSTQSEYEALAIELAKNPEKLNAIKTKLAANRLTTPLFNTPLFTKNLEAAYLKMYERYQAGLTTDHIVV